MNKAMPAVITLVCLMIISAFFLGVICIYFKIPYIQNRRIIYCGYTTIDRSQNLEIKCSPPLRRYRSECDLLIKIEEKWDLTDDIIGIKLDDGSIVDISVTAIDSKGIEYKNNHFGRFGSSARTYFNNIPWGRGIVNIRINSPKPIHVTEVKWIDWCPE